MAIRTFLFGLFTAIVLTVASFPARALAQTSQPELITQFTMPDSRNVKFPDITGVGSTVHASGGNGSRALYWTKADSATSFPDPTRLGDAEGQSDYASTAIHVGADGTVVAAWINQEARQILFRQKLPGQDWGPTRTVIGGRDFRVEIDVAISTNRTIFVTWREPDEPIHFRTSTNGGASWSPTGDVSEGGGFGISTIATGPNNQVLVAYGQGVGGGLQVFVATWDGDGFERRQVSVSGENAGPSVTISGTGVAYVSWYQIGSGVLFAERRPDGSWPVSRLVNDNRVDLRTAIAADAQNNLHIFWTSAIGGSRDLYYAFRPANGQFAENPARVRAGGAGVFNPNATTTSAGSLSYGHVVAESFGGSGLSTRYYLFSGFGGGLTAQPQVEANAPLVGNRTSVTVNFINVFGTPNQIRWRWGAAPTDAASDSNGWQAFANPLTIPIPAGVNTSDCVPEALFTQVRNTTANAVEQQAKQDTILIDNAVSGAVRALNPYSASRITSFTGAQITDLSSDRGASNGDSNYTRAQAFYVEIGGAEDCSNVKDFSIGDTSGNFGASYGLVDGFFANIVPFPNPSSTVQGANQVTIRLRDGAGNVANFTRTFTYDTVKPVVNGGRLTITPDPRATIMATLTFSNVNVTDNLYPGGFWGVWVANSTTPVQDPAVSPQLIWTPLAVANRGANFTVQDWSLASGLKPEQVVPGTYYVYIRFLDGAGNPSDGVIQAQVSLTSITSPQTLMPVIRR